MDLDFAVALMDRYPRVLVVETDGPNLALVFERGVTAGQVEEIHGVAADAGYALTDFEVLQ
jgi:hypothetical protein